MGGNSSLPNGFRHFTGTLPVTNTGKCFRAQSLIYSALTALFMDEQRLGDVIDDHCIKCRRITNHSIVSLVDGKAAKVRCRTCYHDHDYRHEQAPPSKKELKKAEAEAQAALAAASDGVVGVPEPETKLKSKSGHA
jgi:hypothetical protein